MKFARHLVLITNLALPALSHQANQIPWLRQNLTNGQLEANNNTPELSSLNTNDFTTAIHHLFPAYKLRLKRVEEFCDPTVKQYSGYLDVDYGTKHLFFSFFESRNDPDSDPVIMWINGGPGCSSSLGLFMELGPCKILGPPKEGTNGTKWNPYSWNNRANIFFLDQPIGVGFSYADYGETISTTEDAAKDVQAFVTIFFETFKKFQGRDFHMAGESYGGRYIPVFAAEIVDQNKRAEASGFAPINLRSVLIGNGATELKTMYEGYYDIQCKNLSMMPFLDISACVGMRQALPRCLSLYTKECVDRMDPVGCPMAAQFCRTTILEPFFTSRRNPYDMSKPCDTDEEAVTPCYPLVKHIFNFLDRPEIRKALGVHPSIGNYSGCSAEVGERFLAGLEQYRPTEWHVSGLLERGVRVLIYVGTYDWVCNWVGNYKWLLKLDWTGNCAFNAEKDRYWKVDGQIAGFTRSADGLTFATVDGAGHMVPYDKPREALEMLNRWLEEKDL